MTASRIRVALAEDDVLLREGLASLLERSSLEVVGQSGDASQGAINMYTGFAKAARQAGDSSAANNFDGVRTDETGHHSVFMTELQQLTGK